jgi:transposase
MNRAVYPSDRDDAQWNAIEPLVPRQARRAPAQRKCRAAFRTAKRTTTTLRRAHPDLSPLRAAQAGKPRVHESIA